MRTKKDIIAKLNTAVVEALVGETVLQKVGALGMEILPR